MSTYPTLYNAALLDSKEAKKLSPRHASALWSADDTESALAALENIRLTYKSSASHPVSIARTMTGMIIDTIKLCDLVTQTPNIDTNLPTFSAAEQLKKLLRLLLINVSQPRSRRATNSDGIQQGPETFECWAAGLAPQHTQSDERRLLTLLDCFALTQVLKQPRRSSSNQP